MMPTALLVAVFLSQDPAAAEVPEVPAAVAPTVAATPAAAPGPVRNKNTDDVTGTLKKLSGVTPEERTKQFEELRKRVGDQSANPVLPPAAFALSPYADLTPTDQAKLTSRSFITDLIDGDAKGLVMHSGLPFMMEDRRIDRPEDLRNEWAKSLRAKRTDLLTLYDIEVLTPTEMEKKNGKSPARLNAWPWHAPNTLIAVCNLSGHAAVLLLRQAGLAWQVIGYHD